jgi:hypothetical protein
MQEEEAEEWWRRGVIDNQGGEDSVIQSRSENEGL